ncbi:acetyl-CoA hydrolase/transferase C-terminal domain-containing protein [Acidaminococcus fermentans]|uniref:acetyl-CoA hydrolase/transferase family protein n=1 Tax=Acidaminococcus fermentans TaxID=905 RepID=UPI002432B7B4|nr:acetyl-CoA hydrolase/transferase C-terminal domain-containing protein [Acidaminococcus fermentans]
MLEKYRNKIKSPAEAAKVVKNGDWVDFGFGNGFPELFDEALAARRDELQDVKIRGGLVYRPIIHTIDCDPDRKHFQYYSWHLGGYERKMFTAGRLQFVPMLLRLLPEMYRDYLRVDVAVVPVSKPDDQGYCGLGLANFCWKTIMEKAHTVIFEINENMPCLQGMDGSHRVSLDDADIIMEGQHGPLCTSSYRTPSEADLQIARNVVAEIPNGATLSLGVGTIPFTIAQMLAQSDREDLGCHTGTISDAFLALYKAGKLTNAKKEVKTGLNTWNLASGSQELYDWLQDNPQLFYPADLDYVHNPRVIEKITNYISINGGVQLDLMGQENAESVGTRQLSGVGGQLDFLEGAFLSRGGAGYICIESSRVDKKGVRHSNIVPAITAGSAISGPRALIQNVATEYGVAHLTGLSLKERAQAMITVAHPDFRAELQEYAAKTFG